MKASTGAVFLMCLSAASMPRLSVADTGWYGSAEIGQAHYEGLFPYTNPFYPYVMPKDKTGAYRLAAGYQFNPYVGLEAGYLGVGAARLTSVIAPDCFFKNGQTVCVPPPSVNYVSLKTSGFVAEATGTLPVGRSFALYGRAGWYRDHTVVTGSSVPELFPPYELSGIHTIFTYGVGVEWAVSQQSTISFTWDKYANLGGPATSIYQFGVGPYSMGILMLGLAYSIQ